MIHSIVMLKDYQKNFEYKNWISANTDRDQSFKSESCGPIALSWLISFDKYKDEIVDVI